MKGWTLLIMVVVVAALTACGNSQAAGTESVRTVPTSPNAAYQTAFPVPGATDVSVLEDKLPVAEASDLPTPEAAPVVTAAVNEEETPSPVTIDVDGTRATETPAP